MNNKINIKNKKTSKTITENSHTSHNKVKNIK
jgi:hypothetical protein